MSRQSMSGRGRDARVSRRWGAIAIVCVLASMLSACVGIPGSGSVVAGREVSQQAQGGAEFVVAGPSIDDSREEILRGFIEAFKSSGDYDVARQFLSTNFVESWEPRESVLLRSGNARFASTGDESMQYVITANASVDASGIYTPFPAAPATLDFGFVQEEGQWRISSAPNGIVLSTASFRTIFGQHVLYFLDAGRNNLVPDLRWFQAGTAATRIVSTLLAGPPAWLQGAVSSAFPDGTQLTSPKRVSVEANTAIVDLTVEALAADQEQRQFMRLQLEASLGLVPSVANVSISVNGTPVPIGEPGAGFPQVHPQVDSRVLVMMDGKFGFYANGTVTPIEQLSSKIAALGPTGAALGATGTVAAVLGADGVSVVRASESGPKLLDPRPGLITPSLDGFGYVWSAPASSAAGLRVYDLDGTAHEVDTKLPADARIASLDVSRDGARIAILLSTDAGPRLIVAAILRDSNRANTPVSLGEPVLDTIDDPGTAVDATWADDITVATLTSSEGVASVAAYRVGGLRSSLGNPGNAVAIVGSNSLEGLRVIGSDGVISARRGSGWQSTQAVVSFIATQH